MGAVLYSGSKEMPRCLLSSYGQTGIGSFPCAIILRSGSAAYDVGTPRVSSPRSGGKTYFSRGGGILRARQSSGGSSCEGHGETYFSRGGGILRARQSSGGSSCEGHGASGWTERAVRKHAPQTGSSPTPRQVGSMADDPTGLPRS